MTPPELRVIRLQLGMSQEKLALLLGVHRATVARYESGYRKISNSVVKLLERIAEKAKL